MDQLRNRWKSGSQAEPDATRENDIGARLREQKEAELESLKNRWNNGMPQSLQEQKGKQPASPLKSTATVQRQAQTGRVEKDMSSHPVSKSLFSAVTKKV